MSQNATDSKKPLTERQLAALPYLAITPSVAEGAKMARVDRSTIHRWMRDDEFRRELERVRSEAASLAHIELQGMMLKGIEVLSASMSDPDANLRLRAARSTLSIAIKSIDVKELRRRLERVEDAMLLWRRQQKGD